MLVAEPLVLFDPVHRAAAMQWNAAWAYNRDNRYLLRRRAVRAGADLVVGAWGQWVTFRVMRVSVVW